MGVGTGPTAGETGPPVAAAVRGAATNPITIACAPCPLHQKFRPETVKMSKNALFWRKKGWFGPAPPRRAVRAMVRAWAWRVRMAAETQIRILLTAKLASGRGTPGNGSEIAARRTFSKFAHHPALSSGARRHRRHEQRSVRKTAARVRVSCGQRRAPQHWNDRRPIGDPALAHAKCTGLDAHAVRADPHPGDREAKS